MTTKNSEFLPNGYEVPQAPSDYTKLKKGLNKLRILSAPVIGYEYWTEPEAGKKTGVPVRSRTLWTTIPTNADISGTNGWDPKHFWAMIVWNYDTETIQIWQPTQKTILNEIQSLVANDEWGDPRGYNINIKRDGEGLKTEYGVQPSPHSVITPAIKAAYVGKKINLNALFDGANPFEATERNAELDAPEFKPTKESDEETSEEDISEDDVAF